MTDPHDAIDPNFSLDDIAALTAISSPEAWRQHQIETVPLDDQRPILPSTHPLIRSTP